ncbi:MAG: PilZ domain-containing protein [Alphaproteobacteria bacterium]
MNAPATGQERQRHVRTAVLIAGRLAAGGGSHACEIINISIGGARLRLDSVPATLDAVTVQVDGYPDLTGYVVWRADREVGVEFDYESRETAQQMQLEAKPANLPSDRRRTIRVSVLWSGRVLFDADHDDLACMVLNVSTEGARLRLTAPVESVDGASVRLQIDRLGILEGRVAWARDDEMAIIFDEDPDRIAERLSAVLPRAQFNMLNAADEDAA